MEALAWRLDNPSTALEEYYGFVHKYASIKEDTDASEIRLSEKGYSESTGCVLRMP